ncbi:hypothetical protein [Mesorhizobium sp. 1M-11]|uniref:hypothetical protein n=1 Tax=Mesorhizobium sp. 1M-11 TaxID=1529006 RepID=UPI0006C74958|nr:hypothetical protein [Mesorhizobium sp. 1M-11]
MKLSFLILAGALSLAAFEAQGASAIRPAAPTPDGLLQQARVTCAYLTRDGYCVRPRKHYRKHHRQHWRYHRPVYRTYEPYQPDDNDYWRYERPRPLIRIVPDYPPPYGGWDDDDD